MTEETIDIRRKRLIHRARYRGFREADLLIGGFAAAHVPDMEPRALDEFEALLSLNDHDLFNWATGRAEPPANLDGPVFRALRAFDVSKITAP